MPRRCTVGSCTERHAQGPCRIENHRTLRKQLLSRGISGRRLHEAVRVPGPFAMRGRHATTAMQTLHNGCQTLSLAYKESAVSFSRRRHESFSPTVEFPARECRCADPCAAAASVAAAPYTHTTSWPGRGSFRATVTPVDKA